MITWTANGCAKNGEGYGDAFNKIFENLSKQGLDIYSPETKLPKELEDSPPGFGYFLRDEAAQKSDIIVNNCVPEVYIKGNNYSIGFTYWETNRLKQDWVDPMNQMDEIWTTSQSMVDIFIDSGVKVPVYNFKLGVNPKLYFPVRRKIKDRFTFLCIGSPSTRKNSQMSVDAFLKLFDGNPDYQMIYKSNGPPDARMNKDGHWSKIDHPQIKIIDHLVSEEELAGIYDLCDCVLYPTSGEGWGLIPFQGIAKGIPTICTNATACTEYAHMSVPLDFEWSNYNMSGVYENAGMWAMPKFDDLCDKMLYVINNYDKVSKKTYQSAEYINRNMTWELVSKDYEDRLCQILK